MKSMLPTNLVLSLLLMFQAGGLFCQVDPSAFIIKIWNEYKAADSDSLKIEKLSRLAFFYNDYLDDHVLADSLSEQAIQLAS